MDNSWCSQRPAVAPLSLCYLHCPPTLRNLWNISYISYLAHLVNGYYRKRLKDRTIKWTTDIHRKWVWVSFPQRVAFCCNGFITQWLLSQSRVSIHKTWVAKVFSNLKEKKKKKNNPGSLPGNFLNQLLLYCTIC